jgi:hypothetical protein
MAGSQGATGLPDDARYLDNWLADTRGVGLDEAGRTLVAAVANQYAVGWLSLRLKRLVLRTLHDLLSQINFDIRFAANWQGTGG